MFLRVFDFQRRKPREGAEFPRTHSQEVRPPRFEFGLSDPFGYTLNYSPSSGVAIRVTADRSRGFTILTAH